MSFERFDDYHLNYFLLEISKSDIPDNDQAYFKGPFIFVMKTAPFRGFYSERKGTSFENLTEKFLDYVVDMDQKRKK